MEDTSKPVWTGVIIGEDYLVLCEKCLCNDFAHVTHVDATDYFMDEYKCDKCGHHISVKIARTGTNKQLWAGD